MFIAPITAAEVTASTNAPADIYQLSDQAANLARAVRDHHLAEALDFIAGQDGPLAGCARAHLRSAEVLLGLVGDTVDKITELALQIDEAAVDDNPPEK